MGFTLRIILVGLVALVPSDDGKKLTAVFLDTSENEMASDELHIPQHVPLLHYSCANRIDGNCDRDVEDLSKLYSTFGRKEGEFARAGVLPLKGLDISLEGDFPDPLTKKGDFNAHCDRSVIRKPMQLGRNAVSWIIDMDKVAPNNSVLKSGIVDLTPPDKVVAARGVFASGTLVSERLFMEGRIGYSFKPVGDRGDRGHCGQALASRVALEIPVNGCDFTIILTGFDPKLAPAVREKKIVLGPSDCHQSDAVVSVFLANRMKCEKWKTDGPCVAVPCCEDDHVVRDEGRHFELYYKLSAVEPPKNNRPIPYRHPAEPSSLGGGDSDDRIICPIPKFRQGSGGL